MATNDVRLVTIHVRNPNPINITVLKTRSSLDCISIFLQNGTKLTVLKVQSDFISLIECNVSLTI